MFSPLSSPYSLSPLSVDPSLSPYPAPAPSLSAFESSVSYSNLNTPNDLNNSAAPRLQARRLNGQLFATPTESPRSWTSTSTGASQPLSSSRYSSAVQSPAQPNQSFFANFPTQSPSLSHSHYHAVSAPGSVAQSTHTLSLSLPPSNLASPSASSLASLVDLSPADAALWSRHELKSVPKSLDVEFLSDGPIDPAAQSFRSSGPSRAETPSASGSSQFTFSGSSASHSHQPNPPSSVQSLNVAFQSFTIEHRGGEASQ
jgi:hypothetical protein